MLFQSSVILLIAQWSRNKPPSICRGGPDVAFRPRVRRVLVAPDRLNEIWAIDFMHDALYGGRRFRTLNVLDEGSREGLVIEVGTSIASP